MAKKYTMEITYKNSNETMKTVNSDSLKYIVKMWNKFFLTSTRERTTRLLDHTWKVVNNENGKDITDKFKLMAWDEK